MIKEAYFRGLNKQASLVSDALLGIAPNTIVPSASIIGSHIGQLDTPTKQQIQQWDSHKARALIPGVAAYRINSRRRGASKGKTAPIVHETYGGAVAPMLATGAGALIGGALGGAGGAITGGLTGFSASAVAKLIGIISGLAAKKRSKAEQQKADKVVAAKYLLPGYAQYAHMSAAKSADRITQEQAKQKEDEGKHTKQASLRRLLKHAAYMYA